MVVIAAGGKGKTGKVGSAKGVVRTITKYVAAPAAPVKKWAAAAPAKGAGKWAAAAPAKGAGKWAAAAPAKGAAKWAVAAPAKGASKWAAAAPAAKGAGKSSKAGGKGKHKGPKVPFSELSEEKKAEIRAKHEARAEEEGRVAVGSDLHTGTLLRRGRFFGWIVPGNPDAFPQEFIEAMDAMTAEKNAKAAESGKADGGFDQSVIYLRMSDVMEGVKVDEGSSVQFQIYTDSAGVGAYNVAEA